MSNTINVNGAKQYLTEAQWPPGLQDALINQMTKLPIRFIILDDSGSMSASDGARLIPNGNKTTYVVCVVLLIAT